MRLTSLNQVFCLIIISFCMVTFAQIETGTMRPHLETKFLGFAHRNEDPDNGDEIETGYSVFGFGKPCVGLGFGYTIVNNFIIGGRLNSYIETDKYKSNDPEGKGTYFHWGILPYAEYIFLNETFRPFATGTIGIKGVGGNYESGVIEIDMSEWGFLFGAGGGVHFFPTTAFSIDGTMLITYTIGGRKVENPNGDAKSTVGVFEFNINLGISIWL